MLKQQKGNQSNFNGETIQFFRGQEEGSATRIELVTDQAIEPTIKTFALTIMSATLHKVQEGMTIIIVMSILLRHTNGGNAF